MPQEKKDSSTSEPSPGDIRRKKIAQLRTDAEAFEKDGYLDEAHDIYLKLVELDPFDLINYQDLGESFARFDDHNAAIEAFGNAIRIDSEYIDAYIGKGDAYIDAGYPEEALAAYNMAIKIDPRLDGVYAAAGMIHLGLEQYSEAERFFTTAHELDSGNADYIAYLGQTMVGLERLGEMEARITAALQLDPENETALYLKAHRYLEEADYPSAISGFKHLLEIDSSDTRYSEGLGMLHSRYTSFLLFLYLRIIADQFIKFI